MAMQPILILNWSHATRRELNDCCEVGGFWAQKCCECFVNIWWIHFHGLVCLFLISKAAVSSSTKKTLATRLFNLQQLNLFSTIFAISYYAFLGGGVGEGLLLEF